MFCINRYMYVCKMLVWGIAMLSSVFRCCCKQFEIPLVQEIPLFSKFIKSSFLSLKMRLNCVKPKKTKQKNWSWCTELKQYLKVCNLIYKTVDMKPDVCRNNAQLQINLNFGTKVSFLHIKSNKIWWKHLLKYHICIVHLWWYLLYFF